MKAKITIECENATFADIGDAVHTNANSVVAGVLRQFADQIESKSMGAFMIGMAGQRHHHNIFPHESGKSGAAFQDATWHCVVDIGRSLGDFTKGE